MKKDPGRSFAIFLIVYPHSLISKVRHDKPSKLNFTLVLWQGSIPLQFRTDFSFSHFPSFRLSWYQIIGKSATEIET